MTPQPNPGRSWRPTALLWATLAIHVAALGLLVAQPAHWPWALAALLANHLVLSTVGLWPRSQALGPNWVRLPAAAAPGHFAITIDDGPDPGVTPQVLDLLDQHAARATFFCIGSEAQRFPELCREIVRRGHAVENHSQHHYHHFATFGPRRMAREIETGAACLTELTGQRPRFFRPTAGLRNPFLEPILARNGLHLACWTQRGFDTRCKDADVVTRRLTRNLAAGDILLLHDGHAARTASGQPVILAVLPRVLQAAAARGLTPITLPAALEYTDS
ncbi:MAG TPA: polysaccharide deacetylase family protein [Thiobacillus sp.]|nr:MAG: polysaccharide deacetylase family protein [Hydrogenophilales bacterium 16-61-112]OZA49338.1 MAG: polysaccharide deacetylase family protein [Hydrogenophilales bacterium 17-61-76]HQT31852.1 polysaccharide deacetylase family protein [Thiobacillus sp.]HQT69712.1 polysaccharide deacetylase family protein [Thiobacillus sp.]